MRQFICFIMAMFIGLLVFLTMIDG